MLLPLICLCTSGMPEALSIHIDTQTRVAPLAGPPRGCHRD